MSIAENTVKTLTLCLLLDGGRILLGMKKRGFGSGRWNGFGGKLEPGETVPEAARREFMEEAGIAVHDLEPAAVIRFTFKDEPTVLEVHVFRATRWSGEPRETEEMRPRWFGLDEIPFDRMWPDDRHWFPLFLSGRRFTGEFLFDGEQTILDWTLTEVGSEAVSQVSRIST